MQFLPFHRKTASPTVRSGMDGAQITHAEKVKFIPGVLNESLRADAIESWRKWGERAGMVRSSIAPK